jgi:hypothetical protein
MEERDLIKTANRKARGLQASTPHALTARYDKRSNRVVIQLSTRLEIAFNPEDAQGLENAMPAQLRHIEISPSGFGIHFPKLDADLYIPALLEGFLGSRNWMAGRLGAKGGKAKSIAKTKAARKNGRLGGRPKKMTAAA